MTLFVQQGEKINQELRIKSTYGKGTMYVTNLAVNIEIDKKGIVFERLHTQIASIEALSKNKLKITWPEGRQLHSFEFKLDNAQQVAKEMVENNDYEKNFPDLMGVTSVELSDKDKKKIIESRLDIAESMIESTQSSLDQANLNLNMIASNDPDKQKKILESAEITKAIHDKLEMWQKFKDDVSIVFMNRSKKIPKEIDNSNCWNDCWLDIDTKCYVTFNNALDTKAFDEHEEVIKFKEKNMIPNVYPVPFQFVWFSHGYPMIAPFIAEHFDKPPFYLPTMTDSMLNDKMIGDKFGFDDVQGVGGIIAKKIPPKAIYTLSKGSLLILKNGQRFNFSLKETMYAKQRNILSKEEQVLLL